MRKYTLNVMRDHFLQLYKIENRKYGKFLIYHLGNREFYTEVTTVVRTMIYALENKLQLVLDSSQFGYRYRHGWTDYFETFCDEYHDGMEKNVSEHCYSSEGGKGTLFDKIQCFETDKVFLRDTGIQSFPTIMKTFLMLIFQLNPTIKDQVYRKIEQTDLPDVYTCLYIQRGDRVRDEGTNYPVELYVRKLIDAGEIDRPIFVMSNDEKAIVEVQEYLTSNGYQNGVYSFSSDGDDVYHDTIRLLAGTIIASRSSRFVGTRFSHVGTTIRFLHHDPETCVLLEPSDLSSCHIEETKMDPIAPSSEPRQVNVQIFLAGGHHHRVDLPPNAPILHDLFSALMVSSQHPTLSVPTFFQIPLREGRAALSFSREHLVNVVTEPPVLVQSSQPTLAPGQSEILASQPVDSGNGATSGDKVAIANRALFQKESDVNNMEIVSIGNDAFYLFLDIFVHASGKKITAVAAYYHNDIDWQRYGVDYEQVVLSFGYYEIPCTYIPYRFDSWEPSIILDFEHPALEAYMSENAWITFTIKAGPHEKTFRVSTERPPAYDTAISVIIRDENRWITYYLDYYLQCMQVQHVFVYDNHTRDNTALRQLLAPYLEQGQVTYSPWHYRWKNRHVPKQIGQPPQQVHSLNKYANSRWIGFFDVDEFLRIPGQTIPEFLNQYDADAIGGVSFGLRWFMYKGEANFEDIEHPLLSFFHAKRDPLGRKRQKLFVSPRNVRFMRFHWIQEHAPEIQIDDTDIFFHHYYLRKFRFDEGKAESGTVYDDHMSGFSHLLAPAPKTGVGVSKPTPEAKPRTAEAWIAHVVTSFEKAAQGASRLSDDILSMEGMCGTFTRHFYNNLCSFDGCRYVEIGSWKGASLCSAMYRNHISAVSIDNWSEFGRPKQIFLENVSKYKGSCDLSIIEQDCFTVDMNALGSCNVFLYDGNHSKESQYKALMQYYENLENYAIVIIDDWNWKDVREGTKEAMENLNMSVLFDKEILLSEDDVKDMPRHKGRHTWWNGIYVMIINKT